MEIHLQRVLPGEIEKRSMEIITSELGDRVLDPETASIVKRVIHTSADFDYADSLVFSPGVMAKAVAAVKGGATIVTDTNMAKAGVNKQAAGALGCAVECFMADPAVAEEAKKNGTTRAVAAVRKACSLGDNLIFAVGNAPTALVEICRCIDEGLVKPKLVIGVPVGFVNVVESKELLLGYDVPYIVARGRKGGSNVAAAICNAILYEATGRTL